MTSHSNTPGTQVTQKLVNASLQCRHGHSLTDDNTRSNSRGHRICIACTKVSQAKWRSAHLEEAARWRDANREHLRQYNRQLRASGERKDGYTKTILHSIGKDAIKDALENVRKTGKINGGGEIIGKRRWSSLLKHYPSIHSRAHKLKLANKPNKLVKVNAARVDGAALITFVNSIVPRTLPTDMRNDVMSEMIEAILERRLSQETALTAVRQFIRQRFKNFHNRWGDLSIDELRGSADGDGVSLLDIIPDTQRMWA